MRDETRRGAHRRLRHAGLCLLLGTILGAQRPAGAAEPFVVIVNAANPVAAVTGEELSSLFLKKAAQWSGGLPAMPVDLAPDAAARESFSRQIHHKGTAAVKAYWQQMIFSGRDVPPPEKASPREVVAFVAANRGGLGYVPAGTALGAGVKAVDVKP
jgi:ABC-type phosphate transport system substrate-binding protein